MYTRAKCQPDFVEPDNIRPKCTLRKSLPVCHLNVLPVWYLNVSPHFLQTNQMAQYLVKLLFLSVPYDKYSWHWILVAGPKRHYLVAWWKAVRNHYTLGFGAITLHLNGHYTLTDGFLQVSCLEICCSSQKNIHAHLTNRGGQTMQHCLSLFHYWPAPYTYLQQKLASRPVIHILDLEPSRGWQKKKLIYRPVIDSWPKFCMKAGQMQVRRWSMTLENSECSQKHLKIMPLTPN